MLSNPPYSQQHHPQRPSQQRQQQQQQQQQSPDDLGYLSSSVPLPDQQQHHPHQQLPSAGLLTSSYDPHLFDDLCFLDPIDSSSSSLPLIDHEDWFPFSAHHDDMTGMNMDPSFYHQSMPTIDEVTTSTSNMPPPPPLSQSFSPQSEMSMTSPQAQQHSSHQPQPQQQQNQPVSISNNNHLITPTYKGHRRRRSSSLPSIFYSAKKQIIQSPFVPPLFDTGVNQENSYSPVQQNTPDYQQQQQPIMAPIDSTSSTTTGPSVLPPQQQPYAKPLPIQIQRNPISHPRQASPVPLDQQQLDKKLLKVNFNDITVAELKDFLRERNLSVAGRKAELADRLYQERQRVEQQQQQRRPPPVPVSTNSAAASPSIEMRATPPPPIQQLTHRLSDLGFQHPSNTTNNNNNNNNTMPILLPGQQLTSSNTNQPQQQQQQPPILDDHTQQQIDENNTMSQYYKF